MTASTRRIGLRLRICEGRNPSVLRRGSAGEVTRAAQSGGMVRLREAGLLKAARGVTTIEEVLKNVV